MAGILGAAYRALDPILPFDSYLDPRLGGASPPQGGPAPSPQYSTPAVMGFPAIPMGGQPQAQGAQPQKPQKRPSLLQTIWGVAAGYDPQSYREMWTDRQASRQRAEQDRMAQLAMRDRQLAFAETLDPRQRAIFLANPGKWAEEAAVSYRPQIAAPGSSAYVNGQFQQAPLAPIAVSPGSAVFDPNANRELYRAPAKPEIVTTSPGQTATLVDPGGGVAASGSGVPRGIRNNNPGNIEDSPFARSLPGYKGSDGRFAIFDSPEAGSAAQVALLGSYGQRGFNTVSKIINRWAPPSDNNPTGDYVAYVAGKLGVDPNQPLDLSNPQVASAVAQAIGQFENGQTGRTGGAQGPTSRIVAQGAPAVRDLTDEERQARGLPPGVYQAFANGEVKPIAGSQKDAATFEKAEDRRRAATDKARSVVSIIDGILPRVNLTSAGVGQAVAGNFPGSPAYDLARDIETVKANIGFDTLQQMRDASPTGGALGSVAAQELTSLQSAISSLDASQSPAQLKRNLERVKTHYRNWLKTLEGQQSTPQGKPRPVQKGGDPFPGIREGQVVIQGGARYRRQGNQMVRVQ